MKSNFLNSSYHNSIAKEFIRHQKINRQAFNYRKKKKKKFKHEHCGRVDSQTPEPNPYFTGKQAVKHQWNSKANDNKQPT